MEFLHNIYGIIPSNQLSSLAATGGILLLGEPITLRYVLASLVVRGGIFLVVVEKRQPT